jgi:pimeloyl-ACP methyl ester carboxylesterase
MNEDNTMTSCKEESVIVRGRNVRLYRGGAGPQLLFLHDPFCPSWLPFHDELAAHHEVILPVQPGFVGSEEGFDEFQVVEDLVFHYLDLCDALNLDRPALVGASFGGWIAAEWAIRHSDSLKNLILIDALGLRLDEAPAADIFGLDPAALRQAMFVEPHGALAAEILPETPKEEAIVSTILARRTLARFAWQFPDNPRLRGWLYRVKVPTMILWGARDGVVPAVHGKAYHDGIAGSTLLTLPSTGHLPYLEAPVACADIVIDFLRGSNG